MPIEFLRRLATLLLLFSGIALCLQPGGPYVRLDRVDFAHEQARNPYFKNAGEDLDVFIRRRTQNRMLAISSTDFDRLLRLADPSANDPAVLQRIDDRMILTPASLDLDTSSEVTYLHHPEADIWLRIEQLPASEIAGINSSLRHPQRRVGILLLVLAPCLYALLPRRKPAEDELRYGRASSVVIPDFLGFALAAFFFTSAIIVHHHSTTDGWPVFTGILLLFTLFCLSLPLIATHYATLSFRLTDAALLRCSDGRIQTFAWADMSQCTPYKGRAAKRLGLLLILFARGPGMMGQGLLVAGNVERGVEIQMKDGRRLRVMANYLVGFPEIVQTLKTHAVPGAEGCNSI